MNKKIFVAIAAIAAVAIIAGYALIVPALNTALAQQTSTKQYTLTITKHRFAFEKEEFLNMSAGSWSFTITNVSGTVKGIVILLINHEKPRDGFIWFKFNPTIGDSTTVNLTNGNYTLKILIYGTLNSTLTVTVAYP
ncbi:MAG TPA: hypothetical protein VKU94_03670 [Geobacterales bacterium]|nr:hypothetical protein [Geobacterales bacterium]